MRRMPIPHQPESFNRRRCRLRCYGVLGQISLGYPPVRGRLHTCYSPVRRSPAGNVAIAPAAPRLACVKPVASVHPEPGSNSSLLYLLTLSCLSCTCFEKPRSRAPGGSRSYSLPASHKEPPTGTITFCSCTTIALLDLSDLKKYRKHFNDLRQNGRFLAEKRCKITTSF